MSTAAAAMRRSNEVVGGVGWLGVAAVAGVEEAWVGIDGEVCGMPKWL